MKSDSTAVRVALAVVAVYAIVSASYKTFAIPWFTMTEEFPYAQEVLRFLSGDFRQQFFDIPGTPFIAVVTAIFAPIMAALSIGSGSTQTIAELGFEHLQLLYLLMRSVSLLAFAGATWMVFLIARRFASERAALVGAVVFATHPILALTLYHTRIEPFGLLLVSASILSWLRGIESARWTCYAGAGVLAGLAMAARFPLASATLPVFLFYGLARPEPLRGRGHTIDRALFVALLGLALVGGCLATARIAGLVDRNALVDLFFLSIPHGGYPRATQAIARLWLVIGATAVTLVVMAFTPPGRRLLARYRDTPVVTVAVFFPVGLLIGAPTLFVGANFFLASIEMFIERNALAQPSVGSGALSVIGFYVFGQDGLRGLFNLRPLVTPPYAAVTAGVLYNIPLAILFCCGWFRRHANRWLYWSILFGCFVGVVSQFGKLQTTRHLAGWLPWFCVVLAAGADWVLQRGSRGSLAVLAAVFVPAFLLQRSILIAPEINALAEKAVLQLQLERWLRANVSAEEPVFHTCCEPITPSVIFSWMKSNGVAVPRKYLENGSSIWFGEMSTLRRAGEGYVITSRLSYAGQYVDYYRQMNPGDLTDVYHDPRFERRHVIAELNMYDIFHFQLDGIPRLASGGISVREATYGQSCSGAEVPGPKVTRGNATYAVARACNRREACDLTLTSEILGDPAPFCAKDFRVQWTCPDGRSAETAVRAEALGKTIQLRCGGIWVREATYGQSCSDTAMSAGRMNSVTRGNATHAAAEGCNGQEVCDFTLTPETLGDPAPLCAKDFRVHWTCPDGRSAETAVRAEALGKTIQLRCGGIWVREATYGQSCADTPVPDGWTKSVTRGNATSAVAEACNGREVCDFTVTSRGLGDPAAFCAKDFLVQWTCPDGTSEQIPIAAEALGKTVHMRCSTAPTQ